MTLVDQGFASPDAAAFISYVAKEYKAHVRRDGIRSIIIGGILIAIGAGVTAFSYTVAHEGTLPQHLCPDKGDVYAGHHASV